MNTTTGSSDKPASEHKFSSFAEFYPFYLNEHQNRTCRRLHFVGSSLALGCLAMLVATTNFLWLLAGLLVGYGFAWIGHFAFEKNRPATFKHPLYSFRGDWVMFGDILRGRIPFLTFAICGTYEVTRCKPLHRLRRHRFTRKAMRPANNLEGNPSCDAQSC